MHPLTHVKPLASILEAYLTILTSDFRQIFYWSNPFHVFGGSALASLNKWIFAKPERIEKTTFIGTAFCFQIFATSTLQTIPFYDFETECFGFTQSSWFLVGIE